MKGGMITGYTRLEVLRRAESIPVPPGRIGRVHQDGTHHGSLLILFD